jgi:hypothetical protein
VVVLRLHAVHTQLEHFRGQRRVVGHARTGVTERAEVLGRKK